MLKKALVLFCTTMLFCACSVSNDKNNNINTKPNENHKTTTVSVKPKSIENISFSDIASKKFIGQFVLRADQNPIEPLILNHLVIYDGEKLAQQFGSSNAYVLYDVYCDHDHDSDYHPTNTEACINHLTFTGYIIPHGKAVNEKLFGSNFGAIVSTIELHTKGAWGLMAKDLKLIDLTNKKVTNKAIQQKQEILYTATAALVMGNATSPHKTNLVVSRNKYILK